VKFTKKKPECEFSLYRKQQSIWPNKVFGREGGTTKVVDFWCFRQQSLWILAVCYNKVRLDFTRIWELCYNKVRLFFTRICELCYNKVRLDFTPKDLHVPVPATEGRVSRVSYSKTVNIDYRYFRTRMHNLFSSL